LDCLALYSLKKVNQLVGFVSVGISLNWCVCFMLSTWHDNEQPPTRFRAVATIENRLVCG